jgi:alcohol dehydrogenase, propanol-preferring
MKAVQFVKFGSPVEVVEIDKPVPGPGEILLKITAAGLCHSDIAIQEWPTGEAGLPFKLPVTLGHEPVGTVVELGPGAGNAVSVGENVIVYGPWGCGRCSACADGYENYCHEAGRLGINPPGLGSPGALAEYMIVDSSRHLVPIGDLDPVKAAPLADAGLTPYHAIKYAMPKLGGNSVAVVLGAGGLGHIGIQLLKRLTPATVIALDVGQEKLDLARRVGADYAFESNMDAVEPIRKLTDGYGANVVFDFVGVQPSIDLGSKLNSMRGDWIIVGIGGGIANAGFGVLPYECTVLSPYWGTRGELIEVIQLAQKGIFDIETSTHTLDEVPALYEKMHHGKIMGRAVVIP